MVKNEPIGSSIWSIDISNSGDRVVVGSGYPELSIALLHGRGHKEFEVSSGGVAGVLKLGKARGNIIAALVARRGIGTIMNLNHRGQTVWQVSTHKKIENVEVSADGELIAIGTKDGTALCLDKAGKNVWHKTMGLYKGPLDVFFFKDKVFTMTSKGNVYIFDRLGNMLWEQSLEVFVNRIAVSQEGFVCASVNSSKTLNLFDDQGKVLFAKDLGDKITALDVSKAGKFVVAGTLGGQVHVFKDNGAPVFSCQLSSRVNCLAISGNEKYFAVGTNDFFAYLFNIKGDLYWTYRTGIGETDEFFQEFPPGSHALDRSEFKKNLDPPTDRDAVVMLDGFRKVIRQMDTLKHQAELDEKGKKKAAASPAAEGAEEEDEDGFSEDLGAPKKAAAEPKRPAPSEKKGIVIRSWTSFKDINQPLYLVAVKNYTPNPLEAVEVVPKVSTRSFRVSPDLKDFDSIPPGKKILMKFRLEPVDNFRRFEDTHIFSEVNYIDHFTSKMVSINTNRVLVPFTVPQVTFKEGPQDGDEGFEDIEAIRYEMDLGIPLPEAAMELEEFMKGHEISFVKREDGGGYVLHGKDYRGRLLKVGISLTEGETGGRVGLEVWYQNQKSLPPLYYLLVSRLGEILGSEEEEEVFTEIDENEEEEAEWLDEEENGVEWTGAEETGPGTPGGMADSPGGPEEEIGVPVVNIRHIIEKHGAERDLHYRGFYLVEHSDRSRMFDLINNNADMFVKCILLTREYPEKIREVHIYDPELLDIRWISTMGSKGAYSPDQLDKMVKDIKKELEANPHSMVMIDSFEYLLNNNDFPRLYNYISEIKDIVAVHESVLVVNLDFGSISQTQFNQLKKEADDAWGM